MATTELSIAQMALARLGILQPVLAGSGTTVALMTTTGPEATAVSLFYEKTRNWVLQDYPWQFARRWATLTQIQDAVVTDTNWQEKWAFSYRFPSGALAIRRFVSGTTRQPIELPEWELGADDTGLLLFCDIDNDVNDLTVEYTKMITDPTQFRDPFASALAWRMAWEMALPLSVSPGLRKECAQGYAFELMSAKRMDGNEQETGPQPDGPIFRSRG